jgi:hypothetical protein
MKTATECTESFENRFSKFFFSVVSVAEESFARGLIDKQ